MPAAPSVNNYTKYINSGFTTTNNTWYGAHIGNIGSGPGPVTTELAAWMCNQTDDCKGFMRRPSNYEVWLYLQSWRPGLPLTRTTAVTPGDLEVYVKISTTVPKATRPDTTDPSILATPKTKVIFNNPNDNFKVSYGHYNPTGGQYNASVWTDPTTGLGPANITGYNCYNCISSVTVPLGWRIVFADNGWAVGNGGCCGSFMPEGNNVKYDQQGNSDDGMLVENRGFDVDAHWDDMTTLGVDPDDARQIKSRWCDKLDLPSLMSNKLRCTSALRQTTDTVDSTLAFDTKLVNLCLADTGFTWINNASLLVYLKSIVRNGKDTQGQVATLFQTYCRGSPLASASKALGANRTNAICSCINVGDFGYIGTSNCFDAPMNTYPGCADFTDQGQTFLGVTSRIGPIVRMPDNPEKASAINAMGNNPACIAGACAWAERSNNSYLSPYATTCPAMTVQICSQVVTIGVAQSSPINTSCHQQAIVTNTNNYGAGGSPPTTTVGGNGVSTGGPSPPAPAPPAPAPKETSSSLPFPFLKKYLNTSTKQYGGIGGCICVMMMCVLMIIVLAMSGDDSGGKGNGGFAAMMAAQAYGRGATAGS